MIEIYEHADKIHWGICRLVYLDANDDLGDYFYLNHDGEWVSSILQINRANIRYNSKRFAIQTLKKYHPNINKSQYVITQ